MATYQVNTPGSQSTQYPASVVVNDILQFNRTGVGRSGTIIPWTVPVAGKYEFTVVGAAGGDAFSVGRAGGKGIGTTGIVSLKKGEVVQILSGHMGGSYNNGGAGGGGSFTALGSSLASSVPLIIAGGGGGAGYTLSAGNGVSSSSGGTSPGQTAPVGGADGGGGKSIPCGSCPGGGGGGFLTDGNTVSYGSDGRTIGWGSVGASDSGYTQGGRSFRLGGTGGYSVAAAQNQGCNGGFGGGGGNGYFGGGGGGGYSGGSGGRSNTEGGGGGGSYANPDRVTSSSSSGLNSSHGYVRIKLMQLEGFPPTVPTNLKVTPSVNNVYMSEETVSVSWDASTDPDSRIITYEIEFYNGSAWVGIATQITDTKYNCILPSVNTDKAQLRVRAVDGEKNASDYVLSNVFTVAKQLYIIEDRNASKSYKNGNWESI
ncbi:fibronectin type III domain-containing protein [Bacillus cereus]|nr:fibronectin type III domain-containing protein [Bacillus cereus]